MKRSQVNPLPDSRFFDEKSILSTPNPIHSSSMAYENRLRKDVDLDDIPQRDSDPEISLGVLSINSDDCRLSGSAKQRREARDKALKSLEKYRRHSKFTAIPSRFLRPNETSAACSTPSVLSESTISESDLSPGNTSTPRESLWSEDFMMRKRTSLGQSVSHLASSLINSNLGIDQVVENLYKAIDSSENSFQSGSEALAKLEEGEKSWKRQKDIPAEMQEFSVDSFQEDNKMSMGAFFKERSDDLKFLAKSPTKSIAPIALIETSTANFSPNPRDSVKCDSINISDIQKILASQDVTTVALDELLQGNKKSASKSPEKPLEDLEKSQENFTEAIKENISPDCHSVKSILSTRSSSALSSLPSGKLPIATTKTEIIWGCIKPGKSVSHEFVLRNRSSSRVGIQCTVTNPSFRLNKDASEHNFSSMIKVVLHPYESRALSVTFAPTTIGGSVDSLNFTSTDPAHKQTVKQFIRLYGYGGYGNVTIHKIIKDIAGKFLLSLGNIDEGQDMRQTFVIKNCGSLATFTYFDFIANGSYSFSSNIEVLPKIVVLLPEEEKEVVISYNLQKKDFNYIKTKINSCVIDFGKLQVVHGTEVDRARLRKMGQKAKEKNQEINPFVLNLIDKFPGEVVPSDLRSFRESVKSMEEILKCFKHDDIVVTFEQGIDQTLTENLLEDETAMFQSLCENTTLSSLENTIFKEACHIEPNRIILTPPEKMRDMIFLSNNNKTTQYFEVICIPEGLHLRPRDGTIRPGETLIIELHYMNQCTDKTVFKVKILVDNESLEVDVKVVFVGGRL